MLASTPVDVSPSTVTSRSVSGSITCPASSPASAKRGLLRLLLTPRGRCGVLACNARVALPLMFVVVTFVLGVTVASFAQVLGEPPPDALMTSIAAAFVLGVLVLVPIWTMACVQRLHDLGLAGWWLPLAFVPYIGPAFALYASLAPGRRAPNRHGEWRAPSGFEYAVGIVSVAGNLLFLLAWGVIAVVTTF